MRTLFKSKKFCFKINAPNFNYLIISFTCFLLLNCGSINEPTLKEKNGVSNKDSLNYPKPADNTPEYGGGTSDEEKGDIVIGDTIKVKLEADDRMMFNRKEIRVKEGQTVELTLTHKGKLSKPAMGHNFVLLKKEMTSPLIMRTFSNVSRMDDMLETLDKISDKLIAYTSFVGGGESTKVIFDAPSKGSYNFICAFPGHYKLMKGNFIVE